MLRPLVPEICPVPLIRGDSLPHPERDVRRNEVVRVCRGVYAYADGWNGLAPWSRYLARVHAVALSRPGSVFAYESAAALEGLPIFGDPGAVHVLDVGATSSRVSGSVRVHTSRDERQIVDVGGMLFTAAADTVVDIARHRHNAVALAIADAALRSRGVEAGALRAINEGRLSSRGRDRARWALRRASSIPESPLESVSLAAIEWLGFPPPRSQVTFGSPGGVSDRADFWWEEVRALGEADGDLKYDGSLGDPVAALRDRRQRDARLYRHARSILHSGWQDVATAHTLRAMLLGAGVPLVTAEHTQQLATLRRALASR